MNIPRCEHPMPQWERKNWKNLNGEWEFEFDFGVSAIDRKLWEKEKLDNKITVPFCPESKLSGIGYTDFINGVAYKRHFEIEKDKLSDIIILHFGAVDYETDVYVNKKYVGKHKGGYTSFEFDITEFVKEGDNEIFVAVKDNVKSGLQPAGKQASKFASSGCDYTRTTGIWQTIWLEFVPKTHIKSAKYFTDIENGILTVEGETAGEGTLLLKAEFEGKKICENSIKSTGGFFCIQLKLDEIHLWEPGKGNLYDLYLTYGNDSVKSYFGMRNVNISSNKFLINGKSVFMKTVLDQGFYPDGIYTAPTDEDLIKDIQLSLDAGFNGARLHEKVFEARFLYYCDKMGYIVWEEYPNWKLDHHNPLATEIYMNEWQEVIDRDFNHPSIIGWCPFNETWGYEEEKAKNSLLSSIYKLTKRLDKTRPCIDTSGNFHVLPEFYDVHDYTQEVDIFKNRWDKVSADIKAGNKVDKDTIPEGCVSPNLPEYKGQPIFISECGGIQWNTNGNDGWGYGTAPKTPEEFIERFEGLANALLKNDSICGLCYTQLYDIEQEINGLYTYERVPKFDMKIFKNILSKKAKIEE